MGNASVPKAVNMKKLMYLIGMMIFGGMFLTSIIDANFYVEYYSSEKLWQYRIFIGVSALIYFGLVFVLNRKK